MPEIDLRNPPFSLPVEAEPVRNTSANILLAASGDSIGRTFFEGDGLWVAHAINSAAALAERCEKLENDLNSANAVIQALKDGDIVREDLFR